MSSKQIWHRWWGKMPPECWMKSAFINGLLSHVRGLLRLSTRMETLTSRELLERACTVLVGTKDEHLAAQPTPVRVVSTISDVEAQIIWPVIVCSAVVLETREKDQPCENLSGKRKQRGDVSTTLSPIKLKEVRPVIEAVVNGKKCIVLVDSGCSWSFMTRSSQQTLDMESVL